MNQGGTGISARNRRQRGGRRGVLRRGLATGLLTVLAAAGVLVVVPAPAAAQAVPRCAGRPATIVGRSGSERLVGTNRPDVIVAGAGADAVWGLGGADVICAGRGRDRVVGGDGDDLVLGGVGDDSIFGGAGADDLRGGQGGDGLWGGGGDDTLRGDGGTNRLDGGPDTDRCERGTAGVEARCEARINGVTVEPTSGLVTGEDGATAQFAVSLLSAPTGPVTIPVTSSDPSEGAAGATEVQFLTGDWDVVRTVTVVGQDDDVVDGDVAYTIELGAAVGGGYGGIDPADVDVLNEDDDTAVELGAVSGRVWRDDYDGVRGGSEAGLEGREVELHAAGGAAPLSSATTDADGGYRFDDVAPGAYLVRFLLPVDERPTDRDVGADDTIDSDATADGWSHAFDVNAGAEVGDVDLGAVHDLSVHGSVWDDSNGDGVEDRGGAVGSRRVGGAPGRLRRRPRLAADRLERRVLVHRSGPRPLPDPDRRRRGLSLTGGEVDAETGESPTFGARRRGRRPLTPGGRGLAEDEPPVDECLPEIGTTEPDFDGDDRPDSCDPDNTDGPDGDADSDGLTNADEASRGTDPDDPDTDGDGAGTASRSGSAPIPWSTGARRRPPTTLTAISWPTATTTAPTPRTWARTTAMATASVTPATAPPTTARRATATTTS